MTPTRTLIVIASEARARFFRAAGVGRGLAEIATLDSNFEPGHKAEPGRGRDGSGLGVHQYEPQTSERRHRRDSFAVEVVETTATLFEADDFHRIVIAASPKLLGALRDALPPALRQKVSAELDKDLVKVPLADLPKHFAGHLVL